MNPLNSPYNAKGDGVTDDTAAIQSATNAGDVCFASAHTFLINGAITTTVSNKHWQAGMIGGSMPVLKQSIVSGTQLYNINGPTSGAITGDSIIGLDFEGPASGIAAPIPYNEWTIGVVTRNNVNNGLYAGNVFNGWEGDAGIEIYGGSTGATCTSNNEIAYNTLTKCAGYGTVVVAGTYNSIHDNNYTDCGNGVENDNTSQCSGHNTWNHEVGHVVYGTGYQYLHDTLCSMNFTGGDTAYADYSTNVFENSTLTGTSSLNGLPSCLAEGSTLTATYTNNTCNNGCIVTH